MTSTHKPLHHFPQPPSPFYFFLYLRQRIVRQFVARVTTCHNLLHLATPTANSPIVTYVDFIRNHNLCKSLENYSNLHRTNHVIYVAPAASALHLPAKIKWIKNQLDTKYVNELVQAGGGVN